MYALLIVVHLLVCLGLVCVVLIQSGKGGGLAGGAFGGSAQTVLGGRGATDFITRATMVLGAAFFLTSLVLALMTSGGSGPVRSVLQNEARRQQGQTPQRAPGQSTPGVPAAPGSRPAAPAPGGTAPAPGGTAPSGGAPSAPSGGTTPNPGGGP